MIDYRRTHTCGELKKNDCEKYVTLSGWVHKHRDHGGIIFVNIRDRYGKTQLVFNSDKNPECYAIAENLHIEWVISVKGEVIPRTDGMTNPSMPTGDIEVLVKEINILSKARPLPISVSDDFVEVNEETRLKYRYLDMRRGDISDKLIMRHKAMHAMRMFMDSKDFIEITTPILAKSTPEGARDYLIPSRIYPGNFYALPQSPQIFKQLLMISGIDKYFQFAPCFRDEDLRASRQPEFTQLDMEMSFETTEKLFEIIEDLFASTFKKCLGVDITTPFRQIPYRECMKRYGTDKPDLRYGMELVCLDDIAKRSTFSVFLDQLEAGNVIKGLCVKKGADISRKMIDNYTSFVGKLGIRGLAWMKMKDNSLSSSIVKFFSPEIQEELVTKMGIEDGDLVFIIADKESATNQALDHLRRRLAKDRDLIGNNKYEFLWVTEFPLLAWNDDEERLEAEHHPFTAPHNDDIHLLDSDPLKVRSQSYDLVLNGYELASGSQRIHSVEIQEKIFETLKLTHDEIHERFGFFIEALQYGTPPHLGIGIGFDRVIMIMTQTENIRDVIAFPKTNKAMDLMSESPSAIDREQLKELRITVEE